MMYRGQSCIRDKACRNSTINLCEHQGMAFAESADAPFIDRQGNIEALAGNEDAFFWQGPRGFHALFHSKNASGVTDDKVNSCGSMAFSRDTWHWTLNKEPAYDGTVQWKSAGGKITKDRLDSRQ